MLVIMTRVLLVIDVQESFRQGPLWPVISSPGIASDVARLVDGARANGDLVVWVLHSERGVVQVPHQSRQPEPAAEDRSHVLPLILPSLAAGYANGPALALSDSACWSCRRELISSLAKTLLRCHSTVRADRNSWPPISWFDRPARASRAI